MHPFFQELQQGSQKLGLSLSDEALTLLLKYQDALVLWNKAYNLTAIRDPKEMLVKHLLDSLSILKDLPAGGGEKDEYIFEVWYTMVGFLCTK